MVVGTFLDQIRKVLSEEWRKKRKDSHSHGDHEIPTDSIGSKDMKSPGAGVRKPLRQQQPLGLMH